MKTDPGETRTFHGQGGYAMTKNTDDTDFAAKASAQEEIHCTRCGTYLGNYGPGSNGTIPCPKCKEPKLAHRVCKSCGYYDGKQVVATEESK
jgi:hypothetical protein